MERPIRRTWNGTDEIVVVIVRRRTKTKLTSSSGALNVDKEQLGITLMPARGLPTPSGLKATKERY